MAVALAVSGARAAEAQGAPTAGRFAASAYLALHHWAYDYLDLLIARGRLPSLPQLVRPYRRADLALALLAAERSGRLGATEGRWVEDLKHELDAEIALVEGRREPEVTFGREFAVGLKGLSQRHRDLLRPEGKSALFPIWGLALRGEAPGVAGGFQLRWDGHYLNDPQFPGGRVIEFRECDPFVAECAYRIDDAYVEIQTRYVRLFLGRMPRNWGLAGTHGFLVSSYAYTYDHIGYSFGTSRLSLRGVFAPLSDMGGDTARYFSSHRFDWQIRDNLGLSASESVVYGGVNRRIDLALTNPVNIWEISAARGDLETERNTLGLLELWWRPWKGVVTYGGFLVDNTAVGSPASPSIPQWGAHLGLQMPSLRPTLALRADLSILNSLVYRSSHGLLEHYTVQGLSLGRDLTDAVVASVEGDWFVRPGLIVKPQVRLAWRGQDDLRLPWPPDGYGHDPLLVGTTETTIRPAVAGRWRFPYGDVEWDAGLNLIKNQDNVVQGWNAKFVGRVQAVWRTRFP